ncbi:unnamed protein product [Eruca vesicaria subsp. sativa]|uniref:Uncharacterized protein n=1 Tax=Eruca vesicaria subsp. sativa TaxID=29727 RepID=A0ABC8K474_ERUVS|nr:unnamed protein product [Eruca vesicaria subsp. sativa]
MTIQSRSGTTSSSSSSISILSINFSQVRFIDFPLRSLESIMLTETPFRPREKLLEKQRLFQSIHRHTYLKGPMDKVTSVAIPLALAASSLYMIGTGIYNMSNGIGKKE